MFWSWNFKKHHVSVLRIVKLLSLLTLVNEDFLRTEGCFKSWSSGNSLTNDILIIELDEACTSIAIGAEWRIPRRRSMNF